MPHYFFDLVDGDGVHSDDTGLDLPDLDAVQRAVEMTLPRICSERAVGSGPGVIVSMRVRDAWDREVLAATLSWTIQRQIARPLADHGLDGTERQLLRP